MRRAAACQGIGEFKNLSVNTIFNKSSDMNMHRLSSLQVTEDPLEALDYVHIRYPEYEEALSLISL